MKKFLFKIFVIFFAFHSAISQNSFYSQLADSALTLTYQNVQYDSRHLIIDNIGEGQVIEDCLFNIQIIEHYRYGK